MKAPRIPGRFHPRFVGWGVGGFVVWLVAGAVLPRGVPLAIVLVGAVLGTVTALLAMGLILIYRANRIINFAYGSMGGVAGVLAVDLYYTKQAGTTGWPWRWAWCWASAWAGSPSS